MDLVRELDLHSQYARPLPDASLRSEPSLTLRVTGFITRHVSECGLAG